MKPKIVFFHMLNDFSGSPNILAMVIKGLVLRGYEIELYTSIESKGFLSDLQGVKYKDVPYQFSNNKVFTLFMFLKAQLRYFFSVLSYVNEKNVKIYVNTILPFGAAIGASIIKKEVIYHVHEKPVTRNLIQEISVFFLRIFSDKTIFVSKYLFESFAFIRTKKVMIYNSLYPSFSVLSLDKKENNFGNFNILMACSLRTYKGVLVFTDLAEKLPSYTFTLVLNANNQEIKKYFNSRCVPRNLKIYSTQSNLHPFYKKASVVVNLSLPNEWVETFGLTILEAMSYRIPVIVPPVGGISELVDDGLQGFKVDSRNLNKLVEKIEIIFRDELFYEEMAVNAKLKAETFSYERMINEVENIINL